MRLLVLLAIGLGVFYLGLAAVVFLFQDRLLYFPTREVTVTPAAVGLAYEEVRLRAEDGVELQAWYVPAPGESAGTILFFHGNGGNLSHRIDTLELFHRLGYGTLLLSYRGYGASGGRPSEAGLYRDAEAAWRHLVEERGIAPERIAVFGRSLGGAVAARVAERHAPAALVLESTFLSLPELAAELYPYLPARLLARSSFPTRERLRRINVPVLVVHSRQDEIIPYRHARGLWAAARGPKAFLEISGTHNDGFIDTGPAYEAGLRDFLESHLR